MENEGPSFFFEEKQNKTRKKTSKKKKEKGKKRRPPAVSSISPSPTGNDQSIIPVWPLTKKKTDGISLHCSIWCRWNRQISNTRYRFDGFLLGGNGFYWVLLGFIGFYWVFLGFPGFSWVFLGFPGFFWV